MRPPGSPRESSIARISAASPISRSSAKLARKTARVNRAIQGSDAAFARQATLAAATPLRGKRKGFANGMPWPEHRRSMSRHM